MAQPKTKPKAGLVVLQEIFGVNTHIQEVTDLFAEHGYLTIAPSVFDRVESTVQLGYDENGGTTGRHLKAVCD
ncbi:MAG: dienelactone hydrolase family protein, partial [Candidatus Puniceispirillales bacterium]